METTNPLRHWLKFVLGFALCFGIRLIPFRPPNLEPILATAMPFSRSLGWLSGFIFGFFSIMLFDIATQKLGMWTWITALAYGVLAALAPLFLRRFGKTTGYVLYAIIATIIFDAITGVAMGPLLYGQPFMDALTGQIPFTLMHLAGNIVLALFLSPLIDRWITSNTKLEWPAAHSRA